MIPYSFPLCQKRIQEEVEVKQYIPKWCNTKLHEELKVYFPSFSINNLFSKIVSSLSK